MAKGKYAAKAANRLAEIDAGLVAELREKVAAVTAERDAARRKAEQLTRDRDASARAVADRIVADAVRDVARQLADEKQAREADRLRYIAGVSRVIRGDGVRASLATWADLLDVFGLKGQEMADFMGKTDGHPRRIGLLKSDDLRRAEARAAKNDGRSTAVKVRLEDDYGKPLNGILK